VIAVLLVIVPPVVAQVAAAVDALPVYTQRVDEFISAIDFWLAQQGIPFSVRSALLDLRGELAGLATPVIAFPLRAFEFLVLLFGIVALSFYWLLDRRRLLDDVFTRFRPARRARVRDFYLRAERRIGSFVAGLLVVSVIVGVLAYLGLSLLGVPFPLLLALLAALLEVIPILGPIIATVPIVGVALAQSFALGVAALIFWVAVQQLESYVITPLVQKEAVRLRPFVILFAVLAGGAFAGILGALLAIPVAALATMLFDELAPRHEQPDQQEDSRQAD
jgi:predicted PurR-regulated permease PerM